VRLEDVAAQPLIFFDRGSSDWTLTHGLFRTAGLVPNVVMEVETIETAKRMVERGMGFALLPLVAVAPEIGQGKLAAIDIVDADRLSRSLDVIHPRQRPLNADAMAFLHVVRAAISDVQKSGTRRRKRAGVRAARR
jgi:DNA-binding transcriptional LysR family regulator